MLLGAGAGDLLASGVCAVAIIGLGRSGEGGGLAGTCTVTTGAPWAAVGPGAGRSTGIAEAVEADVEGTFGRTCWGVKGGTV